MFKKSLFYMLIFFFALTLWQFIFHSEVLWLNNLAQCIFIFLACLFVEWGFSDSKKKGIDN